jgi:serine/threonine protein kinase/WD40 repeat protein
MEIMQAGARLGPYEIISPLGAGGMGEVYRAKDPRLKREVAIKILAAGLLGDEERQKRFQREAEAVSVLNHPNILSVFDVGAENGTAYIVSELIDGDSLRKLLIKGPVPIRKLLDIAVQIADGLAAAHQAGIVHRDLKPENIMLTREGRVKILDFGLAKPLLPKSGGPDDHTASAALTESGIILGTVRYMSPEQASGLVTDFRSDQFSLGLLLYEMATGKQAFVRNTPVQTLSAIVGDEATPIATLNPKVPPPLRWSIERALAKDPHQRYGATIDLYHELRDLRDHLSEATSSGAMTAVPVSKWTLKRVMLLTLLLLLPVIAFLISAFIFSSRIVDLSSYRLTPLTTDAGSEEFASWSPDGKTVAYSAKVNGIFQIFSRSLDAPTPAQITRRQKDCRNPFWSHDGTRIFFYSDSKTPPFWALWAVGAAGGSPEVVLENVTDATISADGKTMVFIRESEGTTTSLLISAPPGAKPASYAQSSLDMNRYHSGTLQFSPDGSKLCLLLQASNQLGSACEFWILPFPNGKPRRVLQSLKTNVSDFSWMPSNREIVFGGFANSLWRGDNETGKIERITVGSRDERDPSVSPDGKRIAFTIMGTNFDLVEIPIDGSPLRNLLTTSMDEKDPAWLPDGSQYAYVTNRRGTSEIWIRSQKEGWDRPLVTQKDFGEDITSSLNFPNFSPDGQRISYYRTGEKEKYAYWISAVAGGPPVFLSGALGMGSWSPDGEWFAFCTGSADGFWLAKKRVGSGGQTIALTPIMRLTNPRMVVAWSPTGDWITFPTSEGLNLISADGKPGRVLKKSNPIIHGWSRDGQTIYGVWQRENGSLVLSAIDIKTGKEKTILDLGSTQYSNLHGFSLSADGKSFITSAQRSEDDIWILEGFNKPRGFFHFFSRN